MLGVHALENLSRQLLLLGRRVVTSSLNILLWCTRLLDVYGVYVVSIVAKMIRSVGRAFLCMRCTPNCFVTMPVVAIPLHHLVSNLRPLFCKPS